MPLSRTLCPILLPAYMLPHSALSINRNLRGSLIRPCEGRSPVSSRSQYCPLSHPIRDWTLGMSSMKPSRIDRCRCQCTRTRGKVKENPQGLLTLVPLDAPKLCSPVSCSSFLLSLLFSDVIAESSHSFIATSFPRCLINRSHPSCNSLCSCYGNDSLFL